MAHDENSPRAGRERRGSQARSRGLLIAEPLTTNRTIPLRRREDVQCRWTDREHRPHTFDRGPRGSNTISAPPPSESGHPPEPSTAASRPDETVVATAMAHRTLREQPAWV